MKILICCDKATYRSLLIQCLGVRAPLSWVETFKLSKAPTPLAGLASWFSARVFAMCAFDTGVSFAFILAYNSFIYYSLAPPRFDLLPRLSYWQLVYAAAHSSD